MKGCAATRRRILLAVDGRLPVDERFLLDDHLAACEECAGFRRLQLRIEEGLAAQAVPEVGRLQLAAALDRIQAGIAGAPAVTRRTPLGARPAFALAAVVLVLLGLALAWRGLTGEPTPTGDAVTVVQEGAPDLAAATDDLGPEDVERIVRETLRVAFGVPRLPAEAAQAFDEGTLALRRAGWPLLRHVEHLLVGDDLALCSLAASYLGQRGDGRSAALLLRALEVPERQEAALAALAELGETARPTLLRAFGEPGRSAALIEALVRVGGVEVAEAFERRMTRAATPSEERLSLLLALGQLGADAVEPLLRLRTNPGTSRPEGAGVVASEWETYLENALDSRASRTEFGRVLVQRAQRHDTETLLRVAARLRVPEAWAFAEEKAASRRTRELALETLTSLGGPRVFASLLNLDATGRVPRRELIETLTECLTRPQPSQGNFALEFTRELLVEAAGDVVERWLELLFESEQAGAGPALAHLALHGDLPSDEAQWAALAVGDFASLEGARLLAADFPSVPVEARRLRAAVLITLHRILGDEAVEDVLGDLEDRPGFRLTTALRSVRDRGTAVGLHRVARALDEVEDARPSSPGVSRP